MAMLVHGTKSVSVPTGNAGFKVFPPVSAEGAKFYTLEELEALKASVEKPVSTWPGKKESEEETQTLP